MHSWGAAPRSFAPGWSRHTDGYTRPGDLALFGPSMNYKDYRLEFLGQIETRSIGFVVRAHDKENYQAMKLKVLEDGLRPVIAMVHYAVVAGKKGAAVETPLSVMIHRNTPFRVSVDVKGNRLTASIEGQRIESWRDQMPARGGVGFFADAGERARLYWMKVSKNQDWLGVVCSFLAGSGAAQTAEIWNPGVPADFPLPPPPPHRPYAAWRRRPNAAHASAARSGRGYEHKGGFSYGVVDLDGFRNRESSARCDLDQ
jgi:hypothetical protein